MISFVKSFFKGTENDEAESERIMSIPRFTYRRNFTPFPDTELTTDAGWGCCYRCCQGLVSQLLMRMKKINNDIFGITNELSFFQDKPEAMFSIHSLVTQTKTLGIEPGTWAKPSQLGVAISNIFNSHNFSSIIALNSTIDSSVLESIQYPCSILLPLLCGLDTVEQNLFKFFHTAINLPQSVGIVSGYSGSAYYIVNCKTDGEVSYFDPHVVQEAVLDDNFSTFFNQPLQVMNFNSLNPSMLFGFFCIDKEEALSLAKILSEIQDSPVLFCNLSMEKEILDDFGVVDID